MNSYETKDGTIIETNDKTKQGKPLTENQIRSRINTGISAYQYLKEKGLYNFDNTSRITVENMNTVSIKAQPAYS